MILANTSEIEPAALRLSDEARTITNHQSFGKFIRPSSNIHLWYFVLEGPPNTSYAGGQYFGCIHFSIHYPLEPPRVEIFTPNGRFMTCPQTAIPANFYRKNGRWNPEWSVLTFLDMIMNYTFQENGKKSSSSFMSQNSRLKKLLAAHSMHWNNNNKRFKVMFPELWYLNQRMFVNKKKAFKKMRISVAGSSASNNTIVGSYNKAQTSDEKESDI